MAEVAGALGVPIALVSLVLIGAPIVSVTGDVLGTLCVIDNKPLRCGADTVDALCALARRVGGELELSVRAKEATKVSSLPLPRPSAPGDLASLPSMAEPGSELDLASIMRDPRLGVVVLDANRSVIDVNPGFVKLMKTSRERALGLKREGLLREIAGCFEEPARFLRRTAVLPTGPFAAFDRFTASGSPARRIAWHVRPLPTPQGLWHLETFLAEGAAR